VPAEHTWPTAQALPQVPQLAPSVWTLVQTPLHSVCCAGHCDPLEPELPVDPVEEEDVDADVVAVVEPDPVEPLEPLLPVLDPLLDPLLADG
jgi:hypothetical protein